MDCWVFVRWSTQSYYVHQSLANDSMAKTRSPGQAGAKVLDLQDSQDGVEDGPLRIANRDLGGVKQGKDEQHI